MIVKCVQRDMWLNTVTHHMIEVSLAEALIYILKQDAKSTVYLLASVCDLALVQVEVRETLQQRGLSVPSWVSN